MKATPDRFAAAAEALLKQAELSPSQMAERFEAALDVDRWRRLAPFASIEERIVSGDHAQIAPQDAVREKNRLDEDGYFCLKQVFDREWIARMHDIVRAVRADGWPAAFAFVYDDFWSIARSPAISVFLEASLGVGFLQNTVVWAHWVPDAKGVAGWRPHDDYRGGGDTFLSFWIPLSDATAENGCMFLVPDSRSREVAETIKAQDSLPNVLFRKTLQDVVALPVPSGSLIGWRGDVLHWGGANSGSTVPRVSLALEFRSRDVKTTRFERPLIDPQAALPPFRTRLFAIVKALREYTNFEPLLLRHLPLAERIFEETSPGE
ncbi:MAG: hypothetical protein EXR12_04880 [Rhodospirillaceae bacterium]|nr:hypothetical protein [Rhodospirillaceae bacterium]